MSIPDIPTQALKNAGSEGKKPRVSLWVSALNYRIINEIRGKMITDRTDVVTYNEVIQELLDNYNGKYN